MPKQRVVDKIDNLTESVKTLIDLVKDQDKRLNVLEGVNNTPTSAVAVEEKTNQESAFPIPFDFREIVNTTLNKDFGVDVNYLSDRPEFELTIRVPKKYSNASPAHWETYKEDRRVKVIENALASNGVRDYVEMIRENLGPDIRALVDVDRAKVE